MEINENLLTEFSFLQKDQIFFNKPDIEKRAKSTLPEQRLPEILVYPRNAQEVQQVVQVASKHKLPLWYVSTGKNWGYGCKSAPYQGGITMILEQMNHIHEVNVELGYAVIEPGVTYSQLNSYLEERNLPLWTDAAGSTKYASVIGNALDKGRGLTPYADHYNSICGMDIILADGSKMETSANKNFHCKHLYKWGIGPYVDGFFTQSNLGVVVKAGVWLMPKPDHFDFFAFEYTAGKEKFPQFIEDFRSLFFSQGILSRPHLANDFAMLCIVDRYPFDLLSPGRKHLSPEAMTTWKKKHGIMDWTFGGGLYGTKKQICAQKQLVKKYLGPYGTLRFIGAGVKNTLWGKFFRKSVMLGAKLSGKSDDFIQQIFPAIDLFRGKPTDDFAKQVYFKSNLGRPREKFDPAQDNCGFIWTGPLVPFSANHVEKALQIANEVFETFEFDVFVELIVESPRALIALFGVFFDPKNAEESQRAQKWYETMRHRMNQAGYAAYRETSHSTSLALDGNPELKQFLNQIKNTVDEKGILAPGRYGIGKME